jgi:hypothetical protein
MSEKKAFWSSIPGVATGVVGFLSAIAGILGVSAQLGWIGGDDGGNGSVDATGVTTTVVGGASGSSATGATGATGAATSAGEFAVEPTSVSFEPLKTKEATVTVRNTGDVALTMRPPTVTGSGAANFKAADAGCTRSTLAAGRSCEIKVTFTPPAPGEYTAVLVVVASNAPRAVEVDLKGNQSLIG